MFAISIYPLREYEEDVLPKSYRLKFCVTVSLLNVDGDEKRNHNFSRELDSIPASVGPDTMKEQLPFS